MYGCACSLLFMGILFSEDFCLIGILSLVEIISFVSIITLVLYNKHILMTQVCMALRSKEM